MDVLRACLIAGLPVGVLTFLVTYLSYRRGAVKIADDRDDNWGFTASTTSDDERPSNNYLHKKWLSFGGGYYGLIAFVTFAVIEVQQFYQFLVMFEGLEKLLEQIDRRFVSDFIQAQVMNFVDAMVWFQYWPDRIHMVNGWTWLGVSYAGFYVGHWLAERVLSARR